MQIHLSKPGGQREGPFSLEQINADLAARKYTGADYWAWHPGLPEWVPLYSLPGVVEHPSEPPSSVTAAPSPAAEPPTTAPSPTTETPTAAPSPAAETPTAAPSPAAETPTVAPSPTTETSTAVPGPATETPTTASAPTTPAREAESPESPSAEAEPEAVSSGMPFPALEHAFLLTSGDGPTAVRSAALGTMMLQIVGENLETVQRLVPLDVIGQCSILEGLKAQDSSSTAVWRKMGSIRAELLQQARQGSHRICVRSFRIENGDIVSVFLFYNKQKL